MNQSVSIEQAVQMAINHYQSGQIAEAENICKQVLDVEPKSIDSLHLLGIISSQTGRYKNAVRLIRQAIKIKDDIPALHCNLGIAYQAQDMLEDALAAYRKAISLQSDYTEALINMGNIFKARKDLETALECYNKAIAANPDSALAYYNLGHTLQLRSTYPEAVSAYEKAITLHPEFAEAYANLGTILREEGQIEDAAACYRKAVDLKPDFSEAHYNLGLVMEELGMREDATALYRQAVAINPANAEAQKNLGQSLAAQGNTDEAILRCHEAIKLAPDNADNYYNLGIALRDKGDISAAIEAYEQAIERAPDDARILNEYIHQLHHVCAWNKTTASEEKLLTYIRARQTGISPFAALNLRNATSADHLLCARTFSKTQEVPEKSIFTHTPGKPGDKIRIGYLSCDFHDHATAHLLAEVVERHNRQRFEIIAYSYGQDDGSPMRRRLETAFDTFTDIRKLSHAASAKKIYTDNIDILVDLKGYTAGARMHVPAYRPAPVQVNFLGYPGTMGASYIDYIIADKFIIPEGQEQFYSEKIIRLEHCYQPNDSHRKISERTPTRAECGLPEQGFVFCCFNQTYKIMADTFGVWMELLKNVPDSVLWLLECNTAVKANLQQEASAQGVDPARLVFAPRMAAADHLARHKLADLFLDTLPINAHTTASDALWAGLPVVTIAGTSFAGRVAGSLLTAAGLNEFITHDADSYKNLCLELATHPEKLAGVRKKMAEARKTSPLFDAELFTRGLEKAFNEIYKAFHNSH